VGVIVVVETFRNKSNKGGTSPPINPEILDADVAAEQDRINKNALDNDVILLDSVVKWYEPKLFDRIQNCRRPKPPFCAVKGISYGIKKGECFGLLGPNGAGKSTTISMLMLEEYPTAGNITLNNSNITSSSKPEFYKKIPIGVCLQNDALFDFMTVEEHLALFLQLRNKIDGNSLTREVNNLLTLMDLQSYKKRISKSLSGGNKRKLCTAIATIVGNKIIYLDEPSTGMDPGARRALWQVIAQQTTSRGNTVVLTTHSMEEAESVCNKIGIMVNGQLRCLGSSQHLKSRFGGTYRLTVSMRNPNAAAVQPQIEAAFGRTFGHGIQLIEGYSTTMTFDVGVIGNLGQVFDLLEQEKDNFGISSYSLYQVNLEQVFMYHAKQQQQGHYQVATT